MKSFIPRRAIHNDNFPQNRSNSFCIILLTNKQSNKHNQKQPDEWKETMNRICRHLVVAVSRIFCLIDCNICGRPAAAAVAIASLSINVTGRVITDSAGFAWKVGFLFPTTSLSVTSTGLSLFRSVGISAKFSVVLILCRSALPGLAAQSQT